MPVSGRSALPAQPARFYLRKVTAFWFIVRSIMRQSRGAWANSVLSNVIIFDSKARCGRHSVFKAVFKIITLFSCILSLFPLFLVPRMIIEETVLAMETNPQQETTRWLQLCPPQGQDEENGLETSPTGLAGSEGTGHLQTIREMARDFQVSIRTLRFYEDRGLLHPRRDGAHRRYDSRDRLHLKMILKGKTLGFTLTEIRDILAGRGENAGMTELETGLLPEQLTAQIDYLERQRRQIDAAIATLRKALKRPLK
jgi:DNA-binding transcriptional MerR regulator